MSYTTKVEGGFNITPPLTWAEIKDSPFGQHRPGILRAPGIDLDLKVAEEEVSTDDGVLTKYRGVALVMREIDEYRARNLVDQVNMVMGFFGEHTYTGMLKCEGEYNTDMWRVVIRNGQAVRVDPAITWPDEEPF